MLGKSVIAENVTNLTDARYFAARGVDFLLFDMDQISIQDVIEIKEWVEGPKLLLLISKAHINSLDELVMKVEPFAIGVKSSELEKKINHLSGYVAFSEWTKDNCEVDGIQYEKILNVGDLTTNDNGIMVSAGDEDVVGLKAFDFLDDIFDLLEEFG